MVAHWCCASALLALCWYIAGAALEVAKSLELPKYRGGAAPIRCLSCTGMAQALR